MDIIIVLCVLGGIFLAGLYVFRMMCDKKFPPVRIDVTDGGVRKIITYRSLGMVILEDNIFDLLMGRYTICGDMRQLKSDLVPSVFLMFVTGYYPLYRAYRRHNYLCALVNEDNTHTIMKGNPTIVYDGKAKFKVSEHGVLVPFTLELTNEKLTEKEVSNGKAICMRYIEMLRSDKSFEQSSNPLITTLIYSIPLFLIVIAIGIVIYLSFTSVSGTQLQMITQMTEMTVKYQNMTDALIAASGK